VCRIQQNIERIALANRSLMPFDQGEAISVDDVVNVVVLMSTRSCAWGLLHEQGFSAEQIGHQHVKVTGIYTHENLQKKLAQRAEMLAGI